MTGVSKIYFILAAAMMAMAVSCAKGIGPDVPVPDDAGDKIAFYMRTTTTADSKAMIEDTDALLALSPVLHVTDANDANVFTGNNAAVSYTGNGVWRSNINWTDGKEYSFYGYISSEGDGGGAVTAESTGTKVTITEPSDYKDDNDWWSDYLMSYRTSVNGSDRGLVNLMMERLTVGVELYMSTPNDETVILNKAEFQNINRTAAFNMTEHHVYVPGENTGIEMLNAWNITPGTGKNNRTGYSVNDKTIKRLPAGQTFDYGSDYKIMSFLAIPQPTYAEETGAEYEITLHLEYKVEESRNVYKSYTTDLPLRNYRPSTWSRGHKVRYYVTIDSSIGLEGNVVSWKSIDFIEGTLLPD